MSAILPVVVDANYDKDKVKLMELNPHLCLVFGEDEVSFSINFDKDDHYAIFTVKIGELLEALGKAIITEDN